MKSYVLSVALASVVLTTKAQEISYEVSFENKVHHEAQVTLNITNLPTTAPLKVRFARSSPGRYATHEFGKNAYNLKAFDASGKQLDLKQPAGDVYEIVKPSGSVKITYTIFGNWIDGTYAGFDETHAHMNTPAVFAFPVGMDKRPRSVKFNFADKSDWKVATQLKPMPNGTYYAKDFQYFMDSPIEISAYNSASWEVKGADGKMQTIHVASHSADDKAAVENFATMVKKVAEEQKAVFGEYPTFDYGNYYFLHCVLPSYAGDGMEHRNSTVIVQRTPKIAGYESNLLGTFSHEFFHAWNVERLRPKMLEPFNFTQSNISDELWFAEGFTQYYGNLTLKRAGFRTLENIIQTFTGLVNTVTNSPGAQNFSPIQASRYAVFADAGVAVDQTNKHNIFASYYTYGAAVALALDLRLRADFNLTLDDYMKALWKTYGKPEVTYTIPDLENTLGALTKNPNFAKAFFTNFIYGTQKENYTALLANAGLTLQKSSPDKAYSGLGRFEINRAGELVMPATTQGTPTYHAGLDFGDVLMKINDVEIKAAKDVEGINDKSKIGETIEITYKRNGEERKTKLTYIENPILAIIPIETVGGKLTNAMKTFRDKWLESAVK
jgi:predicted metalloprotease with PDZ domain